MRKYITSVITAIATISSITSVTAQQTSPRVELGTLIINNSGFKATSIRTTPVARPTPMHTNGGATNLTFPTRFVVAKADVAGGATTWAVANGWTTAANSAVTGGVVSAVSTGCNSYSETSAPQGQWRLPTEREMVLIALVRLELLNQGQGLSALTGIYWTATQGIATTAWSYAFSLSVMYPKPKTDLYLVRCIRDL